MQQTMLQSDRSIFLPNFSFYSSLIVQTFVLILNLALYEETLQQLTTIWPIVLFLIGSGLVVFVIVEICKWEELK